MVSSNNKKISLVLAVLDGAETLEDAIQSIFDLDYPKENYELVAVNDGSSDNTLEILKKMKGRSPIDFKIIDFKTNKGRVTARLEGAKNAKYDRMMVIDHLVLLTNDVLKNVSKYPDDINLISNWIMDKNRSIYDRVIYIMSKRFYSPYWGRDFETFEITEENFEKVPKGTGGFVTSRDLFIKYSNLLDSRKAAEENIGNEDVLLFKHYLKDKKKFLRVNDVRLFYKNRQGYIFFRHLYRRGPRFVSYYFKHGKILSFLRRGKFISLALGLVALLFATLLFAILFFPFLLFWGFIFILALYSGLCLYLSEEILDFLSAFILLPLIVLSFSLGVLNGIRLHYFSK